MQKWVKILVGVVISLAIFGGVAAAVNDAHPLRSSFDLEGCTERSRYSSEGSGHCYDEYRRSTDRSDSSDRLLALAVGAAAVGLFWLLANLFYFRPRRRRAGADMPSA
jgi:hypothetical protein